MLAIGGVNGRSSLLFLDAATVRNKLTANPWIADATILKLYPGQLQIDIVERTAFALWQQDGRLSVISEDGAVLEPYMSRRFVSLPLVVGKGADLEARDFLALLDRYPQVRAVTKAAILVGERRWNLRLNDGLDIRLPENDVGNALALLSKLDKESSTGCSRATSSPSTCGCRTGSRCNCRKTRPRPAKNCSRKRNPRKRPVTHDRP